AEPVLLRVTHTSDSKFAYQIEIETDDETTVRKFSTMPVFAVTKIDDHSTELVVTRFGLQQKSEFKNTNTRGLIMPVAPSSSGGEIRLTVDQRGRLVKQRGQASLPFALGNIPNVCLEQWPQEAADAWMRTSETTVGVSSSTFLRAIPYQSSGSGEHLNAEEQFDFKVVEANENSVTIRRDYRLATIEQVDGESRFELTHGGNLIVDRQSGQLLSFQGDGEFVSRDPSQTSTTHIKISVSRLSDAELKGLEELWASEAADRVSAPSPEERLDLLAALRSGDVPKMQKALATLGPKSPEEPDVEMAAELAKCLEHQHNFIQSSAALALVNWATNAEAAIIVDRLDDPNFTIATSMQRIVGRLKIIEASSVLAEQLRKPSYRSSAGNALRAIGTAVEDDVVKVLGDRDWTVRMEACRILSEVGTDASVKKLEALSSDDENNAVKTFAKQAVSAIQKRGS
ncbi:MAG: HEAT repeat domain-containing protein, partial [Planctomycetaceae bacterium]|nr:HEAT repeat domain-containing protein [Planctomycetaceae bacterium]